MPTLQQIIPISDRGQITIPKKIREFLNSNYISCKIDRKNRLIIEPVKTREQFFAELEAEEKDWEENGGYSFEEVMKESHAKS